MPFEDLQPHTDYSGISLLLDLIIIISFLIANIIPNPRENALYTLISLQLNEKPHFE